LAPLNIVREKSIHVFLLPFTLVLRAGYAQCQIFYGNVTIKR